MTRMCTGPQHRQESTAGVKPWQASPEKATFSCASCHFHIVTIVSFQVRLVGTAGATSVLTQSGKTAAELSDIAGAIARLTFLLEFFYVFLTEHRDRQEKVVRTAALAGKGARCFCLGISLISSPSRCFHVRCSSATVQK